MSALGQKQTFAVQKGMSALPPIADIQAICWRRSGDYRSEYARDSYWSSIIGLLWRKPMRAFS